MKDMECALCGELHESFGKWPICSTCTREQASALPAPRKRKAAPSVARNAGEAEWLAMSGIEQLRAAVATLDGCEESWNEGFTAEQLLTIIRAHRASAWDYYPSQWTDGMVKRALAGGDVDAVMPKAMK